VIVTVRSVSPYTMEAEKVGFEKTVVQKVVLQASQEASIDIEMTVGTTSSTADVSTAAD
jgi:hypothetical protein